MTDPQNSNTQPQTVNVNLNTYPLSPGRQDINTFSAPEVHTLPQSNMNTVARYNRNKRRDSLIQTDHSHVNPAFQHDVVETRQPLPYNHDSPRSLRSDTHNHNDFAQAHRSRRTDVTYDGHRSTSRRPSTDDNLRPSTHGRTRSRTRSRTRDDDYPSDDHRSARDPVEATARHQQRPWDTLRGTPAYPNQQAHHWSSSSSNSTDSQSSGHQPRPSQTAPSSSGHQPRPSLTAPSNGRAAHTHRSAGRDARVREREAPRANDHREDDSPAFMDPNAQRRRGQPGLSSSQPHVSEQAHQSPPQRQAVSQSQNRATHANSSHMANTTAQPTGPQMPTGPQNVAVSQNRQPPPYGTQVRQADVPPQTHSHALAQNRPEQRNRDPQRPVQTGRNQNQPSPLTQAVLQHHTRHTHNPFADRNQQTQAALQNPGPQAKQQRGTQTAQPPTQPPPATQRVKGTGNRPPTPPPVLQPHQFQTLPKERTKQQHARPPAVPFPATMPVGHGPAVHLPPGHRPQGATHRPTWHVPAHTHTHTQAHRHPNAHQHAHTHRHVTDAHQRHAIAHKPPPAHVRQVSEFGFSLESY